MGNWEAIPSRTLEDPNVKNKACCIVLPLKGEENEQEFNTLSTRAFTEG